MPTETLYKVPEVAERLGLGRTTVYRLIASGEIESIVIGERARRIPASAVDQYIERVRATQRIKASRGAA